MKKIFKKICIITILATAFCIFKSTKSNAASAMITCPPSGTAGKGINIIVTGSAAQWNLQLSANGSVIATSSEFESVDNKTISFSGTYTPSAAGTVNVTLTGTATDSNGTTVRSFGSKSISVSGQSSTTTVTDNSNNNNSSNNTSNNSGNTTTTVASPTLSNLGINPYDFKGFRSANTSYSVTVPNNCTSVNLYATSNNGTVSGTGNKALKEGTNKFSVTVTNSSGSKTYYVSVTRKTAEEGEEEPNHPDETEDEVENPIVVGLLKLAIEGYELDPEFKTDVYEYKIKTDKKLTLEELEQIKEKILLETNDEKIKAEIVPSVSEEGIASFSIVIKDEEKEYLKYTITFEYEEKEIEEKPKAIYTVNNTSKKDGKTYKIFGFEIGEDMIPVIIILTCTFFAVIIALIFAIIAFIKTKQLKAYQDDDNNNNYEYGYDEKDNSENDNLNSNHDEDYTYFEKKQGYTDDDLEDNNYEKDEENAEEDDEIESENNEKRERRSGYRSNRRRGSGRHF